MTTPFPNARSSVVSSVSRNSRTSRVSRMSNVSNYSDGNPIPIPNRNISLASSSLSMSRKGSNIVDVVEAVLTNKKRRRSESRLSQYYKLATVVSRNDFNPNGSDGTSNGTESGNGNEIKHMSNNYLSTNTVRFDDALTDNDNQNQNLNQDQMNFNQSLNCIDIIDDSLDLKDLPTDLDPRTTSLFRRIIRPKEIVGRVLSWQLICSGLAGFTFIWLNCIIQVILDHRYVYGTIHWSTPSTPPTPRIKNQSDYIEEVRSHKLPDLFFSAFNQWDNVSMGDYHKYNPCGSAKHYSKEEIELMKKNGRNDGILGERGVYDFFTSFINWLNPDVVLNILFLSTITLVIAPHRYNDIILLRFLMLLSLLFLLRGLSICVTILPPPWEHCIMKAANTPDDVFTLPDYNESFLYEGMMTAMQHRVTCCDVLYSGHTVNMTLCALLWIQYFRDGENWLLYGKDTGLQAHLKEVEMEKIKNRKSQLSLTNDPSPRPVPAASVQTDLNEDVNISIHSPVSQIKFLEHTRSESANENLETVNSSTNMLSEKENINVRVDDSEPVEHTPSTVASIKDQRTLRINDCNTNELSNKVSFTDEIQNNHNGEIAHTSVSIARRPSTAQSTVAKLRNDPINTRKSNIKSTRSSTTSSKRNSLSSQSDSDSSKKFRNRFLPILAFLIEFFMIILTGLGFLSMMARHFHYTVDILVGCVLTVFFWKHHERLVKTFSNLPRTREEKKQSDVEMSNIIAGTLSIWEAENINAEESESETPEETQIIETCLNSSDSDVTVNGTTSNISSKSLNESRLAQLEQEPDLLSLDLTQAQNGYKNTVNEDLLGMETAVTGNTNTSNTEISKKISAASSTVSKSGSRFNLPRMSAIFPSTLINKRDQITTIILRWDCFHFRHGPWEPLVNNINPNSRNQNQKKTGTSVNTYGYYYNYYSNISTSRLFWKLFVWLDAGERVPLWRRPDGGKWITGSDNDDAGATSGELDKRRLVGQGQWRIKF